MGFASAEGDLVGAWRAYSPPAAAGPALPLGEVRVTAEGLTWQPFDVRTLNGWLGGGETVVVEWTADWCPNCKFIENTVYRQGRVVDRLKGNVRLMWADGSHSWPPGSEKLLQQLGGQSIPFSAVFRGSDPAHPVILRDVYTAETLFSALGASSSVAAR